MEFVSRSSQKSEIRWTLQDIEIGQESKTIAKGQPSEMNRQDARIAENCEPSRKLDELATMVIGASITVHKALGPGFLESVYESALAVEFEALCIPFTRQSTAVVRYRDRIIGESRLDFLVGDELIVELKAIEALAPIHTAQMISYLKATGKHLGLLINFNVPVLKNGVKRIVLSH